MKKIMLLLCAAAFLAVACEREEPTPEVNNPNQTYPSTADVIPNAVTDYDGNSYDAVRIGNQVWMASNLRTTHYANGEVIPEGNTRSTTVPYRYTPSTDVATYGYLYNWPAVMHGASSSTGNPSGVQGVCPNGWHVPSDAEWSQLTAYCSGHTEYVCSGNGNNIAKVLAADHDWHISGNECAVGNDLTSNNATGFSALPAGGYSTGSYGDFGFGVVFWSATEGDSSSTYNRYLSCHLASVHRYRYGKDDGLSVRCLRD